MNRFHVGVLLTTFLVSSLMSEQALAVDCAPAGIFLGTQAQVDAFDTTYPGCTSVTGYLAIGNPGGDITNLDGLTNLTSVGGYLQILWNDLLTNLDGLANLSSVGGDLLVVGPSALTNLDGLDNLTSVGGALGFLGNSALTNLDGLANLTSVGGGLTIYNNTVLTSIDGLVNLISVGGLGLGVFENPALTSINGLTGLISVSGEVYLQDNAVLATCTGLTALLDDVDDGLPGPGPGVAGVPDVGTDVIIGDNAEGCNSIEEILPYVPVPITAIGPPGLVILVLLTLLGGFAGYRRWI